MIFLTVGTTEFSFLRMLQIVDRALFNSKINEKLIVQKGINNYKFIYPNVKVFSEISFEKMIHYLSRTRLIITHGGAGTALLALRYAKNKPLVFPRSKSFDEHVDNHQIFFSKFLENKNLIEAILPGECLMDEIIGCIKHPEKLSLNKKKPPSLQRLVRKLIEYTETI